MTREPTQEIQSTNSVSSAPDGRNRLDLVLNKAALEFNIKGITTASLANVAKAAGISRASIYYYVQDCQDLVFQCYRRSSEITLVRLNAAIGRQENAIEVLKDFAESMLDESQPAIAAVSDLAFLNPQQQQEIRTLIDEQYRRLAAVLTTGQQQGLIRTCDTLIAAKSIIGLLTWAPITRWWIPDLRTGEAAQLRVVNSVMSVLLNGFSFSKQLPKFQPLDLTELKQSTIGAFDRSALATAKRQAILNCASRLFNQKGIDATSVDEIAAQIGVTKKTIYRLMGNKQELVMACSSRGFTIFNYIRDSMLSFNGNRLDALAFAHHAIAECVLNEELSPMLYVIGLGSLTREQRQEIQLSGLLLSAGYQATIVAGVKEGSINATDIECHGLMLPGLFVWLASENGNTTKPQREKIAAEIAAIVTIGLATE